MTTPPHVELHFRADKTVGYIVTGMPVRLVVPVTLVAGVALLLARLIG